MAAIVLDAHIARADLYGVFISHQMYIGRMYAFVHPPSEWCPICSISAKEDAVDAIYEYTYAHSDAHPLYACHTPLNSVCRGSEPPSGPHQHTGKTMAVVGLNEINVSLPYFPKLPSLCNCLVESVNSVVVKM